MAIYPSTIKTFTTKTDGTDYPSASHINDPQSEITAIETELGTLPKGSDATVKARLLAIEAGTNITKGGISQCSMVIGTSDINTTSTSYVDMTDMSITLTTILNSNVLIEFNGIFVPSSQLTDLMLDLQIDGVTKIWARKEPIWAQDYSWDGAYEYLKTTYFDIGQVVLRYLATDLTATSHIFKVRWKVDAGTVYQYGTTATGKGGGPRTLSVMELKR